MTVKLWKHLQFICDCVRLFLVLKPEDIVLMQWPVSYRLMFLFHWIIKKRCSHFRLLVHDINILRRVGGADNSLERRMFSLSDRIILHSEQMKEKIKEYGIRDENIVILKTFDYLTHDEITRHPKKTKEVVFVGQLDKSSFLEKVSAADMGIHINLYGRYEKDMGKDITYKCKFRADNVSIFDGSWGLVWNGDTIDECTGPMGEYLRYNAPHKLSLFIVAHLPIIIWDKAAKARYVEERGIGICVSSLREISRRIEETTDEEYRQMLENLARESALLREGRHLLECVL